MTILTCRTLSKALLCAAAVSAPAMAAAPQDPFLKLSIQDAAVRAQKEDKLLLIYFHNDIVVEF